MFDFYERLNWSSLRLAIGDIESPCLLMDLSAVLLLAPEANYLEESFDGCLTEGTRWLFPFLIPYTWNVCFVTFLAFFSIWSAVI
jgi:hypothetical protein